MALQIWDYSLTTWPSEKNDWNQKHHVSKVLSDVKSPSTGEVVDQVNLSSSLCALLWGFASELLQMQSIAHKTDVEKGWSFNEKSLLGEA